MTDLTKLTADELRVRFDVLRPKMNVPARLVLAEISRRLERLERCEAFCETYADHLLGCACRISLANACDCGFIDADAARAALEE